MWFRLCREIGQVQNSVVLVDKRLYALIISDLAKLRWIALSHMRKQTLDAMQHNRQNYTRWNFTIFLSFVTLRSGMMFCLKVEWFFIHQLSLRISILVWFVQASVSILRKNVRKPSYHHHKSPQHIIRHTSSRDISQYITISLHISSLHTINHHITS